ncbi:MAG: DUF420 domain-containing protein [Myxococcota bacterium]|nr:DUF420 domain-containing protein [Myxococcota bacterium]
MKATKLTFETAQAADQYDALNVMVRSKKSVLTAHPVYTAVGTRKAMCTFMESHVFAVWDFMSLVKALQVELTCTTTPWIPVGDADVRAFINEVVAGEESDQTADGRHLSHLELYIEAMEETGADIGPIRSFLRSLGDGVPVETALDACGAPDAAKAFTSATMDTVKRGDPIEIAAAFCFAREAIIPAMFRPLIRRVDTADGARSPKLRYYFDRHVELDGDSHGELAKKMLCYLCGDDRANWQRAADAAFSALDTRAELWDALETEIRTELDAAAIKKVDDARRKQTRLLTTPGASEDDLKRRDGFAGRIIYILSAVICAAVAFLILGPRPDGLAGRLDVGVLPTLNASLNACVTVLLVVALWHIKRGNVERHKQAMLAAFGLSAAFLVSYVIYHYFKEGPKKYVGDYRGTYLFILLSHIVLAVAVLPLSLFALYRGWHMQVAKHLKVVRYAFPIWLYVSTTGVLIYLMLY